MGLVRGLSVIVFASVGLATVGSTQVSNPNVSSQGVVVAPPAVGLAYSITLKKHQATVTFSLSQQVPVGSSLAWSFSGCDVTPTSSALQAPTVVGDTAGTITATVTVTPPAPQPVGPYTGKAILFGGPIVITSTLAQGREGQTGTFPVSQSWILQWFGTSYTETPNTLSGALVLTGQPSGTTYSWSSGGKIQFVGGSTASTCQVQATDKTVRGGASIELVYYYTVGTTQYNAMDSSDNYYNIAGVANTGYRKITCHMPTAVNVSGTGVLDSNHGGPPWSMYCHYVMELWSQLDPLQAVEVQERCANVPTQFDDGQLFDPKGGGFLWNGNQGFSWTSGQTAGIETGYTYGAMFTDNFGFWGWLSQVAAPMSGGTPALTFIHQYFAATTSATNGDAGVPLDTYTVKLYTDGATNSK